jgi:hypothetical protein
MNRRGLCAVAADAVRLACARAGEEWTTQGREEAEPRPGMTPNHPGPGTTPWRPAVPPSAGTNPTVVLPALTPRRPGSPAMRVRIWRPRHQTLDAALLRSAPPRRIPALTARLAVPPAGIAAAATRVWVQEPVEADYLVTRIESISQCSGGKISLILALTLGVGTLACRPIGTKSVGSWSNELPRSHTHKKKLSPNSKTSKQN